MVRAELRALAGRARGRRWTSATTAARPASGGEATILLDGGGSARERIEATTAYYFAFDESFNVGIDRGTPVVDDYPPLRNAFTGEIRQVVVDLDDGTALDAETRALADQPARTTEPRVSGGAMLLARPPRRSRPGRGSAPRATRGDGPQMLSTASSRPVRSSTGADTPQADASNSP